jgi:methylated-DNA-protein-cysteine methyltransferase-like protein
VRSTPFQKILAVIRKIPRGHVMTYGQVAAVAGYPRGARVVGYALRGCKGAVPWQRVVGIRRKGLAQISIKDPVGAAVQRQMLEREGVKLRKDGAIDLERFGYVATGRSGTSPRRGPRRR